MSTLSEAQLGGYLTRIGYTGPRPPPPTLETLKELQFKHLCSITFENLSIHHRAAKAANERIVTDLDAIYEKLVNKPRGGYCYEQNKLYAAALRAMGFQIYNGCGRTVRGLNPNVPGADTDRLRKLALEPGFDHNKVILGTLTHQIIFVFFGDEKWLTDVGFGGQSVREPIRVQACDESQTEYTGGPLHRIRRGTYGVKTPLPADAMLTPYEAAHTGWYVQRYFSNELPGWSDIYYFTEDMFTEGDFDLQSWWVSNHPDSRFVQTQIAARQTEEGRITLTNNVLKIHREVPGVADACEERVLQSEEELDAVLKEHFFIEF